MVAVIISLKKKKKLKRPPYTEVYMGLGTHKLGLGSWLEEHSTHEVFYLWQANQTQILAQAALSPLEATRILVLCCQTAADKAALVPDMTAVLASPKSPVHA